MKYHQLNSGKRSSKKRVGRGISAGQGKTAGRGTKGQKSRTGASRRPGFEGGQNPLMQRLPKLPGFTSKRIPAENVFTDQINNFKQVVDNFVLADAGLTSSPYVRVKLLFRGPISKKLDVKLQSASQSSIDQIQQSGGKFTVTTQVKRQKVESPETSSKTP